MTVQEAFTIANRKAKHGHKDWIVWEGVNGIWHTEAVSAKSLKSAMLATGTQGRFTKVCASNAHRWTMTWRLALIHFRNARAGYYYA